MAESNKEVDFASTPEKAKTISPTASTLADEGLTTDINMSTNQRNAPLEKSFADSD